MYDKIVKLNHCELIGNIDDNKVLHVTGHIDPGELVELDTQPRTDIGYRCAYNAVVLTGEHSNEPVIIYIEDSMFDYTVIADIKQLLETKPSYTECAVSSDFVMGVKTVASILSRRIEKMKEQLNSSDICSAIEQLRVDHYSEILSQVDHMVDHFSAIERGELPY